MLTIISPATSKALTTIEAVQEEIGTGVSDDLVTQLILRASATVETICGRTFGRERVRETSPSVMRQGGSVLLSRWPVVEIHSVSSDGWVIDSGDYDVVHGVLTGAFGRVTVEYTGGYILPGKEDADLPADIERAVLMLVRRDVSDRSRDPALRSEAVEGIGTFTYFQSTMPSDVGALLDRYRVPVAL